MKKKIIIEVESDADNERIKAFAEGFLVNWMSDNFQNYKSSKITVE